MEPCKIADNLYLPDGNGGVVIVTPNAFVVVDKSGQVNEYEREKQGDNNGYRVTESNVPEVTEGKGRN